jgi:hypothetical protein
MRRVVGPLAGLLLVLVRPLAAQPAASDEVSQLRDEVRQLREAVAALEARLQALPAAPAAAPAPAEPVPAPSAPPPAPEGPPLPPALAPSAPALPTYGGGAAGSKAFNPDIAVIGDFLGSAGGSTLGTPSLEMHEAEAAFQAVVDPYARADFFLTFGPDEVGIEEGFITFPTVPGGLLLKVGKMRTAFGKIDGTHNHTLPWTDRPLVTKDLVGGEDGLADAGISLSRLVPNPWIFLEATGQVYAGNSNVFEAQKKSDLAYVGHLRAYRDLTESTNLDLGGSIAYGGNNAHPDAHTRLFGVDATFRYRPLRRAIYHQLVLRNEFVWSRRDLLPGHQANSWGTYVGLDYQLARRWFLGGRYDYSERSDNPALADEGGSLLLTVWPSEFSQIRAQYRHTHLGEGTKADELLFQFLFSIGAHGAHAF